MFLSWAYLKYRSSTFVESFGNILLTGFLNEFKLKKALPLMKIYLHFHYKFHSIDEVFRYTFKYWNIWASVVQASKVTSKNVVVESGNIHIYTPKNCFYDFFVRLERLGTRTQTTPSKRYLHGTESRRRFGNIQTHFCQGL